MKDIFSSERLVYRAVDPDKDEKLFISIQCEIIDFQLSNARLKVPQGKRDAQSFMKDVIEDSLIGVVICLKSDKSTEDEKSIGVIHLSRSGPNMIQHRHSDIGIDIIEKYQGKGYGSEAIQWCIRWGFEAAGLHRIQLRCFEYNTRALYLYQKLGFKQEGRWREFLWHKGRFWDDIQFSILAREWRAGEENRLRALEA